MTLILTLKMKGAVCHEPENSLQRLRVSPHGQPAKKRVLCVHSIFIFSVLKYTQHSLETANPLL